MPYTKQSFENKINLLFPKTPIKILSFNGVKHPITYQCQKCGNIYNLGRAESLMRKNKKSICLNCNSLTSYSIEDFQKKIDNIGLDITILDFRGTTKPCRFKCNKCEKIFTIESARNLLHRKKTCICDKQIDNNIKIKFEETLVQSYLYPLEDFNSISKPILWKCSNCGFELRRNISDFINRTHKCSNCQSKNIKKTNELIDKEIRDIYGDEWKRLEDYIEANTAIKFKHICGFIRKISPHQLLTNGKRKFCSCPKCSKKESAGEKRIREFLEDNKIDYEEQKPLKIKGKALRVDFYLPKFDLYIEFQGKQHYEPIEYFGGIERLQIQKENDELKRKAIINKGGKILYINYSEIDNIDNILGNSTTIS